ncbi:tellurite resistance TerB family protein [Microcoleus sp. FACHB-68]|uniref:tellurite resistance TerB family protein n=1 Tax=Microcoleus sp. FACHB-68 TaxID=2692826 RepID=UPI001686A3A1|nr:tellurite resistance TerB family protein [Microcoleus sp. FACHB-68]MBD1939845.1 tellurite resistance TerB family protein [Microcoleus sp. FACHB-68]
MSEQQQSDENLLSQGEPKKPLIFNSLSRAEAFAAIALAAIASDGYFTNTETRTIFLVLSRMKLFEGYSELQIKSVLDNLLQFLKQHGTEAFVNSAKEFLSPELQATAFAVSVDLVLSDGVLHKKEEKFLADLQHVLGVSDETADQLIHAMLIKNRG